MIGVLGAGFGLYGHLAAIVECGHEASTLARYRERILELPGGPAIDRAVRYADLDAEIIESADLLVVARRPADHAEVANRVLALPEARGPRALVLEKPMAGTAHDADLLRLRLERRKVRVHTPFLFPYCRWHRDLLDAATSAGPDEFNVAISWTTPKRNEPQSWKYDAASGGGAVNYYLINLFPLLGMLADGKAFTVSGQDIGPEQFRMLFEAGRKRVSTDFRFGATAGFEVKEGEKTIYAAESPFSAPIRSGERDPRIEALSNFYRGVLSGGAEARRHLDCAMTVWTAFACAARR